MCCSSAPDTSGMTAAALAQTKISQDALDWYKQQYADGASQRAIATGSANRMSTLQEQAAIKQNDMTDKLSSRMDTQYALEDQAVKDANDYASEGRKSQQAGIAMADVSQQMDAAQAAQQRNMTRMGVNPSDGATSAMGTQMAMAKALGQASAAQKARAMVDTQGYARKMDAIGLGRGLAANQATSAGVAMNAGNSAVNNAGIPLTQSNQAAATMGQGFTTAINGNASAGNIYGNIANIQNTSNANDNAWMGAAGTAAGGYLSKVSDKNAKTDRAPVSGDAALKAVEDSPVESWNYKPGIEDGGSHIGPMAQTIQKTMGDRVAPNGKEIDLVSMNGINMAAIAALSKKVNHLQKKVQGAKA